MGSGAQGIREPRQEYVLPLVSGKIVLDCGAADHSAWEEKSSAGTWLHHEIASRARYCVAVDLLRAAPWTEGDAVPSHLVVANVEDLPFVEAFDVVVAGELIEHVYNAGAFLDAVWRALVPEGRLVLTTPNALALSPFLKALWRNEELCHPEHTCWYSPQTLRYLVGHHGFEIEALYLVPRPSRWKLVARTRRAVSRLRPLLSEQIVLIARRLPMQAKYRGKW